MFFSILQFLAKIMPSNKLNLLPPSQQNPGTATEAQILSDKNALFNLIFSLILFYFQGAESCAGKKFPRI